MSRLPLLWLSAKRKSVAEHLLVYFQDPTYSHTVDEGWPKSRISPKSVAYVGDNINCNKGGDKGPVFCARGNRFGIWTVKVAETRTCLISPSALTDSIFQPSRGNGGYCRQSYLEASPFISAHPRSQSRRHTTTFRAKHKFAAEPTTTCGYGCGWLLSVGRALGGKCC